MTPREHAVEILRETKVVLATPEAWTKGWYCVTTDGRRLHQDADEPGCKRCLAGALRFASGVREDFDGIKPAPSPGMTVAAMALNKIIAERSAYEAISDFNDDEHTTFEDVHRFCDLAIEELSS